LIDRILNLVLFGFKVGELIFLSNLLLLSEDSSRVDECSNLVSGELTSLTLFFGKTKEPISVALRRYFIAIFEPNPPLFYSLSFSF